MTQCYETEEMSGKKVFGMMLGTRATRKEKKKRGSGRMHKLECSAHSVAVLRMTDFDEY